MDAVMPDRPLSAAAKLKLIPCVLLAGSLAACGGSESSGGGAGTTSLSAAAQLGRKIFSDTALSVSGQQSCATCHVAQFAFASDPTTSGPDHGSPVPLGGPGMDQPGFRNTPSILYASYIPAFHFGPGGNPYGGFFRDGRANTLVDQAALPFITGFEMANSDAAAVIARLRTRPYLAEFVTLYGQAVLGDPTTALHDMGAALAAFETEDPQFHPFSSKYDSFLTGKAQLTAQEQRGLAKFNDPSGGNCAACHPTTSGDGVTPPMFTDFSYDNLGVPRNADIPANSDTAAPSYTPVDSTDGVHAYYDLGICGPFRDNAGLNLSGICGKFKVPTLRNIAVTAPYFHNGQFATLADALGFYVRRDTNPEQFYPTATDGSVTKLDDLPASYVGNVNTLEVPYNRHIGEAPALSADDINDVIAFLCTLTDGYDPRNPTAQVLPAQCQAAVSAATSASTPRTASP